MLTTRRSLITGFASLLAAPAIVRASSIMPVKTWIDRLRVIESDGRFIYVASDGVWYITAAGDPMQAFFEEFAPSEGG